MKSSTIIIVAALLLGIASSLAWVQADDATTTIIIVRHGEKQTDAVDPKDPPLSPAGQARAERLARMLKDADVKAIMVTPFARTRQTAEPLAKQAGMTPVAITADDVREVAARIDEHHAGQTVLVVGHSNTVPAIVAALSGQSVPAIDEAEFDHLYIVTKGKWGARVLHLRYGEGG
jgi:broad specificity phosphatase PhoE